MASPSSNGAYPESAVAPQLFPETGSCNTALPVGEVIEWFDFGQFIELFATDESGVAHPLVLTQDDALLQASLRLRENDNGQPPRIVEVSGGVPIDRVATGDGGDAFRPLATPDAVVVDDVDDLVARGSIATGGTTYKVMLRRPQVQALRDGEPIVLRARAEAAGSRWRAWIQLTPSVTEVDVDDLDKMLKTRAVEVTRDSAREQIALKFEPIEIAALLAGRTVVVRGTAGSKARLVRLRQQPGVKLGYAANPAAPDFAIEDLSVFLANPVVPGADGFPFEVPLTADDIKSLRTEGRTQVKLSGDKVLSLWVEKGQT